MVTGGGANTLIRVTPDGLIVVDTKNPGDENFNRLMEEIQSVSTLPVKYVINTQHHPDHVGTNQKFIDAGATVVALEALKTCMASDPRTKEIPGAADADVCEGLHAEVRRRRSAALLVRPRTLGRRHDGVFPGREGRDGQRSDDRQRADRRLRERRQRGRLGADPRRRPQAGFRDGDPGTRRAEDARGGRGVSRRSSRRSSRARPDAIKAGATRDTLAMQVKTDDIGWNFNAQFYGSLYDELTKK